MKLLRFPQDLKDIESVIGMLDYSASLVPDATEAMVKKACAEAVRYGFAAVAVFPSWIPLVAEGLAGSKVNPQLVVVSRAGQP